MNRQEFMEQLKKLLSDIPESERREALSYYENYFEDAGEENEEKIIQELGSPQKVAMSIKKDLYGENYGAYAYMNQEKQQESLRNEQKKNKTLRNILIVIALVLTFPIWITVLAAVGGVLIGIIGGLFGIAVAAVAVVAALLISGAVCFVVGIVKLFVGFPAVGFLLVGIGLLLLAVGLLSLIAAVWIVGSFVPWAVKGVVRGCKKIIKKGKEQKYA